MFFFFFTKVSCAFPHYIFSETAVDGLAFKRHLKENLISYLALEWKEQRMLP